MSDSTAAITLPAVVVAVTEEVPLLLVVGREEDALPSGPLLAAEDETLELGLRRQVRRQAGIEVGYVEQLYSFGDLLRSVEGERSISIAYLALVGETMPSVDATWRAWYELFPWEDHRGGRPQVLAGIERGLHDWAESPDRVERAQIAFGLDESPWDPVRVLERYELMYEAGLVVERYRDAGREPAPELPHSRPMDGDHRRIAATALGRLRGKLTYRPVVFELLPDRFTLLQLQRVVEALVGIRLHKQNFRRLVEQGRLVEGTGERVASGPGRPAELFRFRREVLTERVTPGFRVRPGLS